MRPSLLRVHGVEEKTGTVTVQEVVKDCDWKRGCAAEWLYLCAQAQKKERKCSRQGYSNSVSQNSRPRRMLFSAC